MRNGDSPNNASGLGPVYMSLHAFRLGQIITAVLGQVDHGDQDGNAART